MDTRTLQRLSGLVLNDSPVIIREWINKVKLLASARELERPALVDHMPGLIEELGRALQKQETPSIGNSNGNGNSRAHGRLRFQAGFDITEVVAEYNALREVLYELADHQGAPISGAAAQIINRTIDHAIAFAVKAYATEKTIEIQRRREEHFSFIVHDLKTPLSAIETAMALINRRYRDTAREATRFFDVIQRNAQRLNALISQALQDHSNLQTAATHLEKRPCDVWPLVEDLMENCRPLAEEVRTELLNEVPEDLWITADAHAISRVFQNLVSNAIKYTKNGRIVAGGRIDGSFAVLWVEDTGEGIAPGRLQKIFERLETDHVREGGLGLGLAIVRDIVESHGGSVSVESVQGKGSKFTFRIPTKEDAQHSRG